MTKIDTLKRHDFQGKQLDIAHPETEKKLLPEIISK